MSYYEPLVYVVPPEEDGWILRTVLQRRLHASRKLISRLKLTEQGITVNGERKYISVRVQAGDRVELRMEQEQSDHILPQNLPLAVIYEDDHILIVDKPAGIVVHPTHGHYVNTLANAVVYYWQQLGVSFRFRPVHRLDQETSGVLAVAKNPYAHQNISEQMKSNQVEKQYLAVVHGAPPSDEGTVSAPIDRDADEPHLRVVTPPGTGYDAVTHYRVVQRFFKRGTEGAPAAWSDDQPAAALVSIRLETGRTHQIRVHMRHLGCPLIGDKLYGTGGGESDEDADGWIDRHALHASELGFYHPASKIWMRFKAELPDDMKTLLARMEHNTRQENQTNEFNGL